MLKKIYYILLLALLFSASELSAYNYMKAMEDGKSFATIKSEATQFYSSRGITALSPKPERMGIKQYLRWEYFWETRLMPDGSFPTQGFLADLMLNNIKHPDKDGYIINSMSSLEWEFLGPKTAIGGYYGIGRINCVKEDPDYNGTSNQILWAGSASGGLWKSTDAGTSWTHKTKTLGSLGIGDFVIHPTNTDTIYCATGDGDAGDAYSIGVIKSTNGGTTWAATSLTFTTNQSIRSRMIAINPNHPDTMFLSTNAGIYRTYDAWATNTKVFTTSSYDLMYKPGNDSTLYVSTYSDIFKTTDWGATWTEITTGLPTSSSRVAIAIAPNKSDRLYAEYTSGGHSGFYRSDNSGVAWKKLDTNTFKNLLGWASAGDDTGGQSSYDLCMVVNPSDSNEVFVGGVNQWKSTDGGANWTNISMWNDDVHADHHCLYMPDADRLYTGNDGGVDFSDDQGDDWEYIGSGLECTQFYAIGISQLDTSLVLAGAQDNSSFLKNGNSFGCTYWSGDGFGSIIDYANDSIMYTESYYGRGYYSTNKGSSIGTWSSLPLPNSQPGPWHTKFVMDPQNHNITYWAYHNNLYKFDIRATTTMTLVGNHGLTYPSMLAISPTDSSFMIIGKSSSVKYSTNNGVNWSSMNLPVSSSLSSIAISPDNNNHIWMTRSGYNTGSKVFHTTNGGTAWSNISTGLPNVPCNTICYVPHAGSYMLFVGTDFGVYYRKETDTQWTQFDDEMPAVVVTELEYNLTYKTLYAATYGRGLWKIDMYDELTVVPDMPVISTPPDGASQIIAPPTLRWNAATNASTYHLKFAADEDFTLGVLSASLTTTSQTLGPILTDYTPYYWKVRSVSSTLDSSAWTLTHQFITIDPNPIVATLEVMLNLYGMTDGVTHQPAPVSIELHSTNADILETDSAEYVKAGIIASNGKVTVEFTEVEEGDYYVIVRANGYLPCIFLNQTTIAMGATQLLNGTTPANIVAGTDALHNDTGIYYLKTGDLNMDLKINAEDAIFIPINAGKNVNNIIPKP